MQTLEIQQCIIRYMIQIKDSAKTLGGPVSDDGGPCSISSHTNLAMSMPKYCKVASNRKDIADDNRRSVVIIPWCSASRFWQTAEGSTVEELWRCKSWLIMQCIMFDQVHWFSTRDIALCLAWPTICYITRTRTDEMINRIYFLELHCRNWRT